MAEVLAFIYKLKGKNEALSGADFVSSTEEPPQAPVFM